MPFPESYADWRRVSKSVCDLQNYLLSKGEADRARFQGLPLLDPEEAVGPTATVYQNKKATVGRAAALQWWHGIWFRCLCIEHRRLLREVHEHYRAGRVPKRRAAAVACLERMEHLE